MQTQPLTASVMHFAQVTHSFSENILNSETWAWEAYVGVRYAFLQTYLELRDLAAHLLAERVAQGEPPTEAQRSLAQHQAAFRDFQALLIGIDDHLIDTPPAVAEWPIRTILTHVHYVERHFLATMLNGLHNPAPKPLNVAEGAALLGEETRLNEKLSLAELWNNYEQLHWRVLAEFAPLTADQLATVAPMWEPQPITVRYRLHRFDTHLREHTNQLEKTIRALNFAPNEAKLLLRQMVGALAEVEGAFIGVSDIGQAQCAALAKTIAERTSAILEAVRQTQIVITAVQSGDLAQVQTLLTLDKRLATARSDNNLIMLMTAIYQGHHAIAAALAEAKGELTIFEGAALGNLAEVKLNLQYDPDSLNAFAADGFTALQLAAFFGHEAVVNHLLEVGADVQAVAQNAMKIQPLHAAAANNHLNIAKALLEKGADVNAKQQDDCTPLLAAIQNKNEAMIQLLREYGAIK